MSLHVLVPQFFHESSSLEHEKQREDQNRAGSWHSLPLRKYRIFKYYFIFFSQPISSTTELIDLAPVVLTLETVGRQSSESSEWFVTEQPIRNKPSSCKSALSCKNIGLNCLPVMSLDMI